MTDAPALLPKTPATETPARDPYDGPPAAERGRGLLPVLCVIGFLVLAAAIYYVWDNPQEAPESQEMRGLAGRIAALEQRTPPDLDALDGRVAALEKRPIPNADSAGKADLAQLAGRLDALEKRPSVAVDAANKADITQLSGRLDALAGRADQLAARVQAADQADGQRLDGLDAKVADLAKQDAADAALVGKLDALERRVAALEKSSGALPAVTDRAALLARLQAASAALEAGQPLGALPGAPPALARYATEKPPTLAELKLAFPAAMRAAEEASIPSPAQANVLDRMWDRVQGLVVVRQGDSVVVGNPAAGVLARAQQMLDAGDLAGAVQAVSGLSGPAAAAMAPWLQSAQDLLAARQAMAALAAHA